MNACSYIFVFSYNIFPECSGTVIIINRLGNKIGFKILLSKKRVERNFEAFYQ